MFDEAKADLIDALEQSTTALTTAEAQTAIDGGDLMSEQVVNQFAEFESHNGTEYVVSADGYADTLPVNGDTDDDETEADDESDAADASEAADDDTADASEDDDADTTETAETVETSADPIETEDGQRIYDLNGLNVVLDLQPTEVMAGAPTDDDILGATVLENSHPQVPDTNVPYFPVEVDGISRDTEDLFYRAIGQQKPVVLEGEAGTGKNQLARAAGADLNIPTRRQEFGENTTVFDVVGEKDLEDGNSHYILGEAAKTAIFGGMYIADEINMASGSVTSYLHPLFEDAGKRELNLRGTGRTLHDLPVSEAEIASHGSAQAARRAKWDPSEHLGKFIHPDFYAVGTCNPVGYAGTEVMNPALRSRCVVIRHPYLCKGEGDVQGRKAEAKLLAIETDAEPSDVEDLVRMVGVLREARRESSELMTPVGHRELRDTVDMAGPSEDFMTFAEAARVKIGGQAGTQKDRQFILDTIDDEL